jgi:hypothetical protein
VVEECRCARGAIRTGDGDGKRRTRWRESGQSQCRGRGGESPHFPRLEGEVSRERVDFTSSVQVEKSLFSKIALGKLAAYSACGDTLRATSDGRASREPS